jgi:hypothetical protein
MDLFGIVFRPSSQFMFNPLKPNVFRESLEPFEAEIKKQRENVGGEVRDTLFVGRRKSIL